jgi:hypothetical protein
LPQPDKEIAGCINDIGVPFTVADLLKPNPQQIQMVLEWFAELLMNITRETVEPAIRAATEDICADYADIFPADTRNLMAFFISLRKLMIEVRRDMHSNGFCRAIRLTFVVNSVVSMISPSPISPNLHMIELLRYFPISSILSGFASRKQPLSTSISTRQKIQRLALKHYTGKIKKWNSALKK